MGSRMSHVLIVEDEAHLAKGLQYNLEAEGHSVAVVGDGERALDLLLGKSAAPAAFDAVVLGASCFPARMASPWPRDAHAKRSVPVLMLTARGRPEDVLEGFASGADDCAPKLLDFPILLAGLQGLLRRREWMQQSLAPNTAPAARKTRNTSRPPSTAERSSFGKLELRVNGNTIQLTLMEAELLPPNLIRNKGCFFPQIDS